MTSVGQATTHRSQPLQRSVSTTIVPLVLAIVPMCCKSFVSCLSLWLGYALSGEGGVLLTLCTQLGGLTPQIYQIIAIAHILYT